MNELAQFAKSLPPWAILFAGVAVGWLKSFWAWLYNHTWGMAVRRIMVSVEVEEFDHADAYLWLQTWVEERLRERRISALQLRRRTGMHSNYAKPVSDDFDDSEDRNAYELVPAYGTYPFLWRGRVNPPDAIKNQRIETAAQEQRAITEQQTKLAEDQRKAAEQSRAAADNAYREAMQLSPDQFLQLERIKMQRETCGVNGKATCTFFIGSGPSPVIDVGRK